MNRFKLKNKENQNNGFEFDYLEMKNKIFDIIRIENSNDFWGKLFDISLTFIIFLNLFITFFLTFEESIPYKPILVKVENFTIFIFFIEYLLRIWTADLLHSTLSKTKARLKFIFSFFGIIDLLTLLPYLLPMIFPTGMIAFRLLRVARIFHLFKLNNKYDSFNVIVEVLNEKKNQIVSACVLMITLMLASSLCMYHLEHNVQPEVFKNAFSGIWWSVSAILTVGYGDIFPITTLGRIFAIIISILGVGIVAIPTGIITSGFYEKAQKIKRFENCLDEHNLRFVSTIIDENHKWKNTYVKDLNLPNDLIIAIIERDNDIIIPKGDIQLLLHDKIVLGAKNYSNDKTLELKEMIIKEKHPWKDCFVKDLDISRQTIIISIKRNNKIIIPNGNTIIKSGDIIILCRKNNHIDEFDEFYV